VKRRLAAVFPTAVTASATAFAPVAWSVQTLGHATSGTFPAGGPVTAGVGGGPGGAGGGRLGGQDGGRFSPGGTLAGGAPPGPGAGAGPGGGDSRSLTSALAYIRAHGGGTLAVSSQNGAASAAIIESDAGIVAIGGFSGRESQVSAAWLADRVESGQIRWVLTGDGDGPGRDGRVGSSDVMAAVQATCTPVAAVDGLYDCRGMAGALRA
jgi:hypothetical protein